jgi:bacteriorhodopsin
MLTKRRRVTVSWLVQKDALDMMASLDYNFFCCVCGCIPESKQDNEYQWQQDYAF